MNASLKTPLALAAALAASLALPATAQAEAGDWFVRGGVASVQPESGNGRLAGGALAADIDNNAQVSLVAGKFITDTVAIELLAATPFSHTVALNGADAVDFKHLPPTVSLQYYFRPDARVRPFVGAGLNYTWTFDEEAYGPLAGTDTKIGNSWGMAAQLGLDIAINDQWSIVADARWIDIDADVRVNGADVGTATVDPMVFGLAVGYRF
jgi:outer membrane protein